MVSSPAMVPTTSGQRSASRATASGCAPPTTVLKHEQVAHAVGAGEECGEEAI